MDNNKVIIYTLIILLITAVIFNPVITGQTLWPSRLDVYTAPTTTSSCAPTYQNKKIILTESLTLGECKTACGSYFFRRSSTDPVIADYGIQCYQPCVDGMGGTGASTGAILRQCCWIE